MTRPTITIEPASARIDEPLAITLDGFAAHEPVTVTARTANRDGVEFRSAIVVETDARGHVDLATAVPITGSYLTADPTGLLWSLAPDPEFADTGLDSRFIETGLAPFVIGVHAEGHGGATADATIERIPLAADVRREPIPHAGLVGTLFIPQGTGPHPVIVVVPGSGGGVPESLAALYASHGFAAVALAYFRAGAGVPPTLTEIPLEYFATALDWIAGDARLDDARIAIDGVSRGGELALLLASRFPAFRAVVAWVPSNHLQPAIQAAGATEERASWTVGGEPLPYLGFADTARVVGEPDTRDGAFVGSVAHLRRAADRERLAQAVIPVERINGGVLVVSGRDDTLWPSAVYGDWVIDRLRDHGFAHEAIHLSYENAGHTIGAANGPATLNRLHWRQPGVPDAEPLVLALGGTPEGIARARADAWPKVLAFLRRQLAD